MGIKGPRQDFCLMAQPTLCNYNFNLVQTTFNFENTLSHVTCVDGNSIVYLNT